MPGQIIYNGAKIQILDLPGIIEGAKDGKGRGKQVIAVARTCHLIFIVLDVNKPLIDKRVIESELEGFGIRINKTPPNIVMKRKDKGGINITNTVPLSRIDTDVSEAAADDGDLLTHLHCRKSEPSWENTKLRMRMSLFGVMRQLTT